MSKSVRVRNRSRRKMSKGERQARHGKPQKHRPRGCQRKNTQRPLVSVRRPTGRERRYSNISSQATILLAAGISEIIIRTDEYYVCSKCGNPLAGPNSTCRSFSCFSTKAVKKERSVTETVTIRTGKPTQPQMEKAIAVILARRALKREKSRRKKEARRARNA